MGNSASSSFPNSYATIETTDGKKFQIAYAELIDHVLLLRQAISYPEMTQKGPTLDYFIKDYCKRMAQQEMTKKHEQLKLPWQIEWIWHVHRLHPVSYYNDCTKQLSDGKLVDKLLYNSIKNRHKKPNSKVIFTSINSRLSFEPSIDLANAVVRQRDFLQKFLKHYLYFSTLKQENPSYFENLVQNYVSFMKLARKNELIVPTFDIDLIWHTHMRRPSHYQAVSTALCGFILDHDDSIEQNILSNNYQKTADRWKATYISDYGHNIDRKHVETSQHRSSCATVLVPVVISDNSGHSSCGATGGDCGLACGGGGGDGCGDDGAGCGGGCGSGCGGGCGGD